MRTSRNYTGTLVLAVAAALCLGFLWFTGSSAAKKGITERLTYTNESTKRFLAATVDTDLALSVQMAASPIIKEFLADPADPAKAAAGKAECESYRESFVSKSVFYVSTADHYYYSTLGDYQITLGDSATPWYDVCIADRTSPYILNVDTDGTTGDVELFLDVSARNSSGDTLGLVGTGIDLTDFVKHSYGSLEKGVTLQFFDGSGALVITEDLSLFDKNVKLSDVIPDADGVVSAAKSVRDANTDKMVSFGSRVYSVSYVPDLDWYIVSYQPVSFGLILQHSLESLIFVLVFFAAFALVLAMLNKKTRRIDGLTGIMSYIADSGDLNTDKLGAAQNESRGSDEVSRLAAAFCKMTAQFAYYGNRMRVLADNDFREDVKTLGGNDVCGEALNALIGNFRSALGGIRTAAKSVYDSGATLSEVSGQLSGVSREQKQAVDDLTGIAGLIQNTVNKSASMASEAAQLTRNIKISAEDGGRKMTDMIRAVREIDTSSKNISKVIKAVDDIAFQTNILALNASVEAARAGQAGKGFAVVAEEVRSLAGKSAQAARETGQLLEVSMQKAADGVRIAEEVDASLREIIDGVSGSAEVVGNIAELSGEQTEELKKLERAIGEVSETAGDSSSGAEKSAELNKELSAQADILTDSVNRFSL